MKALDVLKILDHGLTNRLLSDAGCCQQLWKSLPVASLEPEESNCLRTRLSRRI